MNREQRYNLYTGFTITELLITLTIIVVLAAIAIPSYQDYLHRKNFATVVSAAAPYKDGVSKCFEKKETLQGCNAGTKSIPKAITSANEDVASLTVVNGVITVVPVAKNGIKEKDTYVLTPTVVNGNLTWKASGGSVEAGYTE